jgi:signal transduction histidine kinase
MSTLATPTVTQLREIDLFDGLTDDELSTWAQEASLQEAEPGTRLTETGDRESGVILLLDGTLDMLAPEGEVETRQGTQVAPTWIGAVPALIGAPAVISLRASTHVAYATISRDRFIDLTLAHRAVFDHAMAQMKPVMSRVTTRQQQHDRMESLGTMAAGLAHELNNPASAARRAAQDLADALIVLSRTIGVFVESGVEREQAAALVALQTAAMDRCAVQSEREELSSLDAADREDELIGVLEELGVPEPWNLAAPLAAAGLDRPFLGEVADTAGPLTPKVVRWIAASLSARQLAAEITQATGQMSELVGAIKGYAYTRPGQVEEVDLRQGIKTTLILLKHKFKHTSIRIEKHFDESLGPVAVYSSEMNQVFTNLLDNALDALDGSGTITITTRADGDCAEVDIADDGPGIPEDVRRRVFDPFFTTKDVGKGTGLGLDTARRIVVDRHHGSLTVQSRTEPPTGTVFRVRIPIDAARR